MLLCAQFILPTSIESCAKKSLKKCIYKMGELVRYFPRTIPFIIPCTWFDSFSKWMWGVTCYLFVFQVCELQSNRFCYIAWCTHYGSGGGLFGGENLSTNHSHKPTTSHCAFGGRDRFMRHCTCTLDVLPRELHEDLERLCEAKCKAQTLQDNATIHVFGTCDKLQARVWSW